MTGDYTEIKVKGRVEKRANRTEDQEVSQVQAEARASEALAETEKRHNVKGKTSDAKEKNL